MNRSGLQIQIKQNKSAHQSKDFTLKAQNGHRSFNDWILEHLGLGVHLASLPTLHAHPQNLSTVIVIHGLGEDPRAMACWSDLLVQNGMNVLNILLAGHGRGTEGLAQTSLSQWRLDVVRATEIAKDLTDEVHLWGFSLGGTLALDAVLRRPVEFRGATLLSPGLAMSEAWHQRVKNRSNAGLPNLTEWRPEQNYEPIPLSVLESLNQAIADVQSMIETLSSSNDLPPTGLITASRDPLLNTQVAKEIAQHLGFSNWTLPISEHNLQDSGLDLEVFLKFAQNHCGLIRDFDIANCDPRKLSSRV